MKQISLVFVILFVSASYAAPTEGSEECTAERADGCTQDAMALASRPNHPLPSTVDEVLEVCE